MNQYLYLNHCLETSNITSMIILASNSWLRKTIMEASRLRFTTDSVDLDERALEQKNQNKTDEEVAIILASAKAKLVQHKHPDAVVIAADTFALLPSGKRLHKPANPEEAVELCLLQSGKTIKAVTGMVMSYRGKVLTNTTVTNITYITFDRPTIKHLLEGDDATIRNSGLGFFSDAPGFTLVKSFNGSYTGAMGLPMEIVRQNLKLLNYSE